jgi:hypothetical protein
LSTVSERHAGITEYTQQNVVIQRIENTLCGDKFDLI